MLKDAKRFLMLCLLFVMCGVNNLALGFVKLSILEARLLYHALGMEHWGTSSGVVRLFIL